MTEQDRKARVIIENNTTATIELCCEDICVEVAISSSGENNSSQPSSTDGNNSSGSPSTSDRPLRKEQITGIRDMLRPLRPGASAFLLRIYVNNIDELLEKSNLMLGESWPLSESIMSEGVIVFDIHNITRFNINHIRPLYELSRKSLLPIIVRVLEKNE